MDLRKLGLMISAIFLWGISLSAIASEDDYPKRPIELILNYPPGGSLDLVMRIVQPAIQQKLGVPIILTTKGGGAGALGADFVAKAKPDGYTVGVLGYMALNITPQFNKSVPYKYTDFTPIGTLSGEPMVLVSKAGAPWKTFDEMVSYATKNPGKLTFGTPGMGSAGFVVMELIKMAYGIDVAPVHFQGAGPALTAVLGGHVDMASGAFPPFTELIKTGKLNALVVTSLNRLPVFPTVPTMAEKGYPEASLVLRSGLVVSQKCSATVVKRLEKAHLEIMRDPAILSQFEKAGQIPDPLDREATWKAWEAEYNAVNKIVKKLGI